MTGSATAPPIFRLFAFEVPRNEIPDRCAEDVVVRDTERREECQLSYQNCMRKTARSWRSTGGDVQLKSGAKTIVNVHGGDGKVHLVVGITASPILTHGDTAGQVARLDAAI